MSANELRRALVESLSSRGGDSSLIPDVKAVFHAWSPKDGQSCPAHERSMFTDAFQEWERLWVDFRPPTDVRAAADRCGIGGDEYDAFLWVLRLCKAFFFLFRCHTFQPEDVNADHHGTLLVDGKLMGVLSDYSDILLNPRAYVEMQNCLTGAAAFTLFWDEDTQFGGIPTGM